MFVTDNARWHHAKVLAPWLHRHRKSIRLDFLPPYSPELNHIEQVWKLTHRLCTHNDRFELLEQLVGTSNKQLELWMKPTKDIASSMRNYLRPCMVNKVN